MVPALIRHHYGVRRSLPTSIESALSPGRRRTHGLAEERTVDQTPRSRQPGRPEREPADERAARAPDVSRLSTPELIARIAEDAQTLVKAEIQLAKTELRADVERAVRAVKRVGAAAGFLVAALVMLMVTLVLALAVIMPAWAAALVVAVVLLAGAAVAAGLAARARPGRPLERTRQNLREDLWWTRKSPQTAPPR
jgi:uncharacterized membrane protein YqjE